MNVYVIEVECHDESGVAQPAVPIAACSRYLWYVRLPGALEGFARATGTQYEFVDATERYALVDEDPPPWM